jgi:hypothetical protein
MKQILLAEISQPDLRGNFQHCYKYNEKCESVRHTHNANKKAKKAPKKSVEKR